MPNTLVHFGIQGLASRQLFPSLDLRWILLGCILPDVPWILRRVLSALPLELDVFATLLYAQVQSSLAFSLLLCAALGAACGRGRLVFVGLASNTLLHLLLDAVEIKWGNGVILFAPFSWEMTRFDLVWPGSRPIAALTVLGLAFTLWAIRTDAARSGPARWPSRRAAALAAGFLLAYFVLPLPFLSGPERADNFSIGTLRDKANRPGSRIELDRRPYRVEEGGHFVRTFSGEDLRVIGERSPRSGTVSLRGTFTDPETIEVHELREARQGLRDGASYLGLALLGFLWLRGWREGRRSGLRPSGAARVET